MKIKTQFYLLILGIVVVPLMALLIQHLVIEMRKGGQGVLPPPFEWAFDERRERRSDFREPGPGAPPPIWNRPPHREGEAEVPQAPPSPPPPIWNRPPQSESEAESASGTGPPSFWNRPSQSEGEAGNRLWRPPHNEGEGRNRLWRLIIGLVVLIALFAALMCFFIARSITKSVTVLEKATRRIAAGELDLAVDVRGSNEITSLTASLNRMRDALKEDGRRRARFIMGISHDLKTPLAIMQSYAELIDDGLAVDAASQKNAAGIILAKASQLEQMINHLIEFVKMDTGEWQSCLSNVAIADFLKKSARRFILDAETLRHRMTSTIEISEDTVVPLDEDLVVRALENLVGNAIRHTPEGSSISLDAIQDENGIRITISDNGPGIAAEELPHIFETFYRGSASRREQGMGIGLSVVKWVIDSHGWTINADSDSTGTRFMITVGAH